MSLLLHFVRVSRRLPCPVCERADWCLLDRSNPEDPERVLCKRVESSTAWGDAGWLHLMRNGHRVPRPRTRTITLAPARNRAMERVHRQALSLASDAIYDSVAEHIGVEPDALRQLEMGALTSSDLFEYGILRKQSVVTFPMKGADGAVLGVRLRSHEGSKFAIPGSSNALFLPSRINSSNAPLLLCEGESDTAAMLSLGFSAIGRPGCTSGTDMAVRYITRGDHTWVVVMADADDAGRRGARAIALRLCARVRRVQVVAPPSGIKDARAWKLAGATREDVLDAIAAAPAITTSAQRGESAVAS